MTKSHESIRLKKFDIIEVPLDNNKKVFIQYLENDKWGKLIAVFNYFVSGADQIKISDLHGKKWLFPPIIVRINSKTLEQNNWKIIGNLPQDNFVFPSFVSANIDASGRVEKWFIYDGKDYEDVGSKLSNDQKQLEFYSSYHPSAILKRIINKEKPWQKLIENNYTSFTGK